MNFKSLAAAAGLALLTSTGAFASDATPTKTASAQSSVTDMFTGYFDTSSWHDAAGHVEPGKVEAFNPMKPNDWAKIIKPEMHSKMHMSATNPAHYGQYMAPGFFMQFADPAAWMTLANPASYNELIQVASDPKTLQYWMQPGAYMHGFNPAAYTQMFNPASYMQMATVATESMTSDKGWGSYNAFNPFHWMKQMSASMTAATKTAATEPKTRVE